MASVWDSLRASGLLQWLGSLCSSLQHTAAPPGRLAPLHCCCVLGGHPMALASPHCWGLCCNWAVPSPLASPGLYSGTPALSHSAKPQPLSMTPSCLQNQHPLGDSYTTKLSCQHKVQPAWLPLDHSCCAPTWRTHFPEGFTSMKLVSS